MAHWREFVDPLGPPGGYLAWKEVARRTSLSRTTAWRLQRKDEFPRAYSISPGRGGHREDEIDAWKRSRDRRGVAVRRAGDRAPPSVETPQPDAKPIPSEPRATPQSPASDAAPTAAAVSAPPQGEAADVPLPKPAGPRRRRSEHARAIARQMLLDF